MSKSSRHALLSALLVLLLSFATAAWSQKLPGTPAAPAPPAAAQPEKDPFGRETPQGFVSGLIRALGASDYERVLQFFATNSVSDQEGDSTLSGQDLARRFQQVLDRAGSVLTPAELSEDPNGNVTDGLPENVERFGVIKTKFREIPLLAVRVKRDGKSLWLVSDKTLNEIPAVARSITGTLSVSAWMDRLPKGPTVYGAPLLHWIELLIAAGLSYIAAWVLIALLGPLVRLAARNRSDTTLVRLFELSAGPLRLLIVLLILGTVAQALGISIVARYRVLFLMKVLGWAIVALLLWRSADLVAHIILRRMSRQGQATAYSAVSFLKHVYKALVILLFFAAVLRAFGVNLTAGLAALGIGGLAVALGAQKLLENIIGSVTLIADRPIRVGDFCRFGATLGTVEEIGIRSTRLRTLDRTILTVPNGELSSLHIENFAERDRFWFHPTLNLRYETTPEQIRSVLDELRSMLDAHPNVERGSMRVRFIKLAESSLDVEIFAYVSASDYAEFLEAQEQLLLKCMDIIEKCGTSFAFPSQTIYLNPTTT